MKHALIESNMRKPTFFLVLWKLDPVSSSAVSGVYLKKSEPISLTGSACGRAKTEPPSARLAKKRKRKGRFQVFLTPLCGIARLCLPWRQILLFFFKIIRVNLFNIVTSYFGYPNIIFYH